MVVATALPGGHRAVTLAVTAALALSACETRPASRAEPSHPASALLPTGQATTPAPAACGATTALERLSDGTYVQRAGPFWFLAAPAPRTKTEVTGPPSKVVFQVLEAYEQEYVVTGVRCADGAPMRFWYGHDGTPVPSGPPGAAGDLEARLPPTPALPPRGFYGHGGYLLPSSAGRWRLDFSIGGRVVDSVVLDLVFR